MPSEPDAIDVALAVARRRSGGGGVKTPEDTVLRKLLWLLEKARTEATG